MTPVIVGLFIVLAILLVFFGHFRKSEKLLKSGITFSLLIIAALFIYCHTQFPIQPTVFGRQREMTAISLFFAVMIAIVWGH